VVDEMIRIPDAASIAAAHVLSARLFRRVGGSTGTNFMGTLCMASLMRQQDKEGSLVTLICDSGDRYSATYFDDNWLAAQHIDIRDWRSRIETFLDTGEGVLL
jgi:cysteine synthase A